MADVHRNKINQLESPASDAYAITPSDANDETTAFKAIYVGGAGDVVVVTLDDTTVTFAGAVAGSILPIRGIRVNSTNTTATNLVGLV